MTPTAALGIYRRARTAEGEPVTLRRYSGSGASRLPADYPLTAVRVYGTGLAADLVDGLQQRDRIAILMDEDVVASGFPTPIRETVDKLVTRDGRELTIKKVDDDTRRIQGTLIAYELIAGV